MLAKYSRPRATAASVRSLPPYNLSARAFSAPLRFEDEVEIHLLVAEKKSKALTYAFRLRKLNTPEPHEVARGAITVVCVKLVNGQMKATNIPKAIADKIQERVSTAGKPQCVPNNSASRPRGSKTVRWSPPIRWC